MSTPETDTDTVARIASAYADLVNERDAAVKRADAAEAALVDRTFAANDEAIARAQADRDAAISERDVMTRAAVKLQGVIDGKPT